MNVVTTKSRARTYLHHIIFSIIIIILCHVWAGCKKLIAIDPPVNRFVGSEAYSSNSAATSVVTGIYTDIASAGIFSGLQSVSLRCGLSADELVSASSNTDLLTLLYKNALTNNGNQLFWGSLYSYVFRVNGAIEGISASENLSDPVKKQLLGEVHFLRAFFYFYLVNLYGDVPLLTTTNLEFNSTAARTSTEKVYTKIHEDLFIAENNISDEYVGLNSQEHSSERIRPNKATVHALNARVYLYEKNWPSAELEASFVINNPKYKLIDLDKVFLANSDEAIWQVQSVQTGFNTEDAKVFILEKGGPFTVEGPDADFRPVYLSDFVINEFEDNDQRKSLWISNVMVSGKTYPFAHKYKRWLSGEPRTEYQMLFRLAEQHLIRAEARSMQGRLNGINSAAEDLNKLRARAGLSSVVINPSNALNAILHERFTELFTEMGNRWLDLKRTETIHQIMNGVSPLKGGVWESYKTLYPIPVQDIQRNPNLRGHQNPGYPEQ